VALAAGAHLINDIRGLRDPAALAAAARLGVGVCVMHMQGEPATMQNAPAYGDVVAEVREWLLERVAACRAAGVAGDAIAVDPGFGFGKNAAHNLALFRSLEGFTTLGVPLLVGLSRKSLVGHLTGRPVGSRLAGSVALPRWRRSGGRRSCARMMSPRPSTRFGSARRSAEAKETSG